MMLGVRETLSPELLMMCLRSGIEGILILFNLSTGVYLRLSHVGGHMAMVQATNHSIVHGFIVMAHAIGL